MRHSPARKLISIESPWAILLPLLIGYAVLVQQSMVGIRLGLFPDPDDAMRLLQVRDWLDGQSWFDVTQHRLNAPMGVPMHWSRLVDVPIAAVILLFRPLVGLDGAEFAARLIIPIITLGVVMLLVRSLGRKLGLKPIAVFLAVCATPFSIAAGLQMSPMRIDHHGWQIALGVVATIGALITADRRAGIVAGAAVATWLNISLEALPYAALIGGWFAVQWLADAARADRLRSYAAALAGCSFLLFVATKPLAAWGQPYCDAVAPVHLFAFLGAAIVCLVAARPTIRAVSGRVAVLVAAGAVAGGTVVLMDPACLRDPFANLDPLVRFYWYNKVLEGLPAWRQPNSGGLACLAQPAIGLIGLLIAWRKVQGSDRARWTAFLFLFAGSTVAALLVIRSAALANVLGLPGTAYLGAAAFTRARAVRKELPRVFATVVALCAMLPAAIIPLTFAEAAGNAGAEPDATAELQRCMSQDEMRLLRQLPTGNIAAPLDISPAIIVNTSHSAIASGHHRNLAGMADVVRLFTFSPSQARAIMTRRKIDYLVVCPRMAEMNNFAKFAPTGFWAKLASGHAPDWLEPIMIPGVRALRIWRIRRDVAA